jgi:hypothetical protein
MAFERGERGHRLENYPRRGESQRDRRDRGHDDRDYFGQDLDDDDTRPAERRRWRGHDYYRPDDEFERGRDYRTNEQDREPSIGDHRRRFLRRDEDDPGYGWRDDMRPYQSRRREAYREDDRGSGPYVGRGPKGYRRSDERILEEICERLTDHPTIDASDVEVKVVDGDVTLLGRVESRTVKHLTENMVETVSGVKEVHNHLRVMPLPSTSNDWEEPREPRAPEPTASKTPRR